MATSIQGHVVGTAEEAGLEFFRYAEKVPAGKLEWQPLEAGQSILAMSREIAVTPLWALSAMGALEGETNDWHAVVSTLETVSACQEAWRANFARWADFVLAMPDSKLAETKWLPFNGGRDHTFLEMLESPRWNTTYHLGQVAYIQTLYGDKEVH